MSTVFNAFSHGVIHFVWSVKNLKKDLKWEVSDGLLKIATNEIEFSQANTPGSRQSKEH